MTQDAAPSSDARFRTSDSLEIIILNQTPFGDDAETINSQVWLPQKLIDLWITLLIIFTEGLQGLPINKLAVPSQRARIV